MLEQTVINYINLYKKVKDRDLRIFLKSSPYYPSLYSVMTTLQYFGLNVKAGKCDINKLESIFSPILLHLIIKGAQTLVIAKRYDDVSCLIYSPSNSKWVKMTFKEVMKVWDGIVIYTQEKQESSRKTVYTPIIIAFSFVLACLIPMLLPAIIGELLSVIAYKYSNDRYDKPQAGICNLSKITNCKSVSNSKYGNILGIRLADLSVSFFSAQLSIGVLFHNNEGLASIYLISCFLLIPITLYSILSQVQIGRICPLCLLILGCLFWQSIKYYQEGLQSLDLISYFCIAFLVFFVFLNMENRIRSERFKNEDLSIKNLTLERKECVLRSVTQEISFNLRNQEDTDLILFLSPSCKHCKEALKVLLPQLLDNMINTIHIVPCKVHTEDETLIKNWRKTYYKDKKQDFARLILDWCFEQDLGKELSKWKDLIEEKVYLVLNEDYNNFAKTNGITGVPRIAINNYLLPAIYEIKDVSFVIMDGFLNKDKEDRDVRTKSVSVKSFTL